MTPLTTQQTLAHVGTLDALGTAVTCGVIQSGTHATTCAIPKDEVRHDPEKTNDIQTKNPEGTAQPRSMNTKTTGPWTMQIQSPPPPSSFLTPFSSPHTPPTNAHQEGKAKPADLSAVFCLVNASGEHEADACTCLAMHGYLRIAALSFASCASAGRSFDSAMVDHRWELVGT